MLATNVQQQAVLLFEGTVANVALESIHEGAVLVLQILHEMATAMLLQQADSFQLLITDLAFQLVITLRGGVVVLVKREILI